MAELTEIQRNVLGHVGSTVKSTPAAGKFDANQLLFELSATWNSLAAGGTLDLQPLYAALMSRGVAPNDAALVCLLMQKREDRLNMRVKLPQLVETLPAKVRDELLAKNAQSAVRLSPVGSDKTPSATRQATSVGDKTPSTTRQTTQVVPFTPPSSFGDRLKATFGGRISPGTIIFCAVLCVLAGVANWMMREKPPETVKVTMPAPLEKATVYRDGNSFLVFDTEKDFDRTDKEFEDVVEPLRKVFMPMNADRISLCKREDMKCRKMVAIIRPTSVMWLEPGLKARKRAEKEGQAAMNPPPAQP